VSLEYTEKYLLEQLHDIRLRHEREVKPIIDQLVRIEQLKPPRPMYAIMSDDLQKFLMPIDPLQQKDLRDFGTSVTKVTFDGTALLVSTIPFADVIKPT
jgi:hypothetical protein